MKLGVVPENLIERLALFSGLLPPGIFESWFGIMLARTIMVATKLDIFEALAPEPLTATEVAKRCSTHPRGTEKLLNALVGLECLRVKGEHYALRRSLRAWILKDGKYSFRGQILLHFQEWNWWEHCEEYVRTGKPLHVHETMTDEDWGVYQRGMRSGVEMPADRIAKHLALPRTHDRCWISVARTDISRSPSAGGIPNSGPRSSTCQRQSSTPPHSWLRRVWEIGSFIVREMS